MAISLVAVGDKIKASVINAIIGVVNSTALGGIIPASLDAGGSGTVTQTPNGTVTFTNVTSVSLNGVFSGTYDNYRVTWSSSTRTAAVSTAFRFRASRSDITTSTYDYVKTMSTGTTATVTSSTSNSNFPIDHGAAASMTSNGVMDVFGPSSTTLASTGTIQSSVLASSACYASTISFANEAHTAFDGFTLSVSSGTFSGVLRVYGYNNLT